MCRVFNSKTFLKFVLEGVISEQKAKHFDATTMFTYSHANMPLGQSVLSYMLFYKLFWLNQFGKIKTSHDA